MLSALVLTAIHGMIGWWKQGRSEGGAGRAYTRKIRQGCEGGGKGPLIQTELSATLATRQDQSLIQSLVLNDQGGKAMDVSENVTGTLRAQAHGHAHVVFQKSEDEERET